MKGLYQTTINCGRDGDLYGIFIAEAEDVTNLIESQRVIEFGSLLGKHSDIRGFLTPSDVRLVTTDEAYIAQSVALGLPFGINPFDYLDENAEELPPSETDGDDE